jgi:hypothetical protein
MATMTIQEIRRNPFSYAISSENWFKSNMHTYTPFTTFFYDLSIGECFGVKGVKDTYKSVMNAWENNYKYMTEFVMCLNLKIWQLHEIDRPMAILYDKLWKKTHSKMCRKLKGEELRYYLEAID